MKLKGIRMMKLADITTNVFVREKLDEDRCLYLGQLVENGIELPEIEVSFFNGNCVMVDGRHRKWVYESKNLEQVKVKILEFDNEVELIGYAFKANVGSKPPSAEDTQHTVEELIKRRTTTKRMSELLGLPMKLIQTYADSVKKELKRRQLCHGKELVQDHRLSIKAAAEKLDGVTEEELKLFLFPQQKRRRGKVFDLEKEITKTWKSNSMRIRGLLTRTMKQVEVGELSPGQMEKIIDRLEAAHRQYAKTIADWRGRLQAKTRECQSDTAAQTSNRESA